MSEPLEVEDDTLDVEDAKLEVEDDSLEVGDEAPAPAVRWLQARWAAVRGALGRRWRPSVGALSPPEARPSLLERRLRDGDDGLAGAGEAGVSPPRPASSSSGSSPSAPSRLLDAVGPLGAVEASQEVPVPQGVLGRRLEQERRAQQSGARRRAWLEGGAAALIYLALGLYVLRPVLGQFNRAYLGSGELEGWLWRYWWMKQLIAGAWTAGRPFYAIYVALVSSSYPETGNVFDLQWASMPLEALFAAPTYYNLKVLLFLLLNGMAGYALGRALVADWTASVLCGVVLGFGSYGLLEVDTGRIRHLAMFPMAWYALALMRMQASRFDLRRAAWAGVTFGLCSATYLYYGMSALFFSILWLLATTSVLAEQEGQGRRVRACLVLWVGLLLVGALLRVTPRQEGLIFVGGLALLGGWLGRREVGRRLLRAVGVVAVVGVLCSMPYATWYLEQTFVQHQALREVTYFQDFPPLQTLIAPQNVHTSDDNLLNSMQRFRGDSPSWDFLFRWTYRRSAPLVFTGLAALGLLLGRRRPWLWVSTAALGYSICIGPYLRQGLTEEYVRDLGPWTLDGGIPTMHIIFFKYMPYFSRLFSPIRIEGLFLLGFCVVVAWSVASLFAQVRWQRLRPLLLVPVLGLMIWQMEDSGQARLSVFVQEVPAVYAWLMHQPEPGVIELPYREGDFLNYYQIYHGKRVLGNWASGSLPPHYPAGRTAQLAASDAFEVVENPLLHWLRQQNDEQGGSAPVPVQRRDVGLLVQAGYRYAILHERGSFVVQGSDGHEHYVRMRDALVRRFGEPVFRCREYLRDRAPSPDAAYSANGAEFDITVFDLTHDSAPQASERVPTRS